jgi:hypothetical protein
LVIAERGYALAQAKPAIDKSRMRFQPSLQFLSGSRIDEITDFR